MPISRNSSYVVLFDGSLQSFAEIGKKMLKVGYNYQLEYRTPIMIVAGIDGWQAVRPGERIKITSEKVEVLF